MPSTEPACDRSRVRAAPGRGDDRLVASGLAGRRVVGDAAPGQDLGQAPVHHLDLAERADHHVRRLQVAVDHPPGVGVGHRLATCSKIARNRGRSSAGSGALGQQRGQGAALDQLHGEVGPAVGEGAQLVDRDDAGVLELAADLGLLDEPADQLGVVAVVARAGP